MLFSTFLKNYRNESGTFDETPEPYTEWRWCFHVTSSHDRHVGVCNARELRLTVLGCQYGVYFTN